MKIQVTQADIDGAEQNNSYHCVVANAITRSIPGVRKVLVDVQTVRYSDTEKHKRYIYLTPPSIQGYIVDFDAGLPLSPFAFQLDHPIWVGQLRATHDNNLRGDMSIEVGGSAADKGTPRHIKVQNVRPPAVRPHGAYREYGVRKLRRNAG